jgi:hypothetical protein
MSQFKNNFITIGVAALFAVGAFALRGLAVQAAVQANLLEQYTQGNFYNFVAFAMTGIGALAVGITLWQVLLILIALSRTKPANPPVGNSIVPASADIEINARQVRFDVRRALELTKAGKTQAQILKPLILERGLAMAKLAVKFARRMDRLNEQLELTGWIKDALAANNTEEALIYAAEASDLALRTLLIGGIQEPQFWAKLRSYVAHRLSNIRKQRTEYRELLTTMFILLKQMQDDITALSAYIGGAEVDEIMLTLTVSYDDAFNTLMDYQDILLESPYAEHQRALITE